MLIAYEVLHCQTQYATNNIGISTTKNVKIE